MDDPEIVLNKILDKFTELGEAKSIKGKVFGYIKKTNSSVHVTREDGDDTVVPFAKILQGIEAYHMNSEWYNQGPSILREAKITHVTSPVWALLHLMKKKDYQ
jgi:hypothetical protein